VDGSDTLFPIFKQHGKKSNIFNFLRFRSPLLLEQRATANQRAAFCFGLVLIIILGLLLDY
jgi:hypothetical protein